MRDEDIVGGPLVQLVIYEPGLSDHELLEAMASVLRRRGATTKPLRWGSPGLEVLNGTGALPPEVAERLEPERTPELTDEPLTGGIVDLMTGGEWFDPALDLTPVEERAFGIKVRDCFINLVAELQPLYGVVLFESSGAGLASLDTYDNDDLFGTGWVNLARVDAAVVPRLRRAVQGTSTADLGGGLFWTTTQEFALDGLPVDRTQIAEHIGHRVIEALTGRTIPPPVAPTQQQLDDRYLPPESQRPMVWVWDAALDAPSLLAAVTDCAGDRSVVLGEGDPGWQCVVVDLPRGDQDEAMEVLGRLADQVAPSWISLSWGRDVYPPGSDEVQYEGFAMQHIWLNRHWLGQDALAEVDRHLAGAYRAEHGDGVYLSTDERFNPAGRVPAWDDDEAFDRTTAAATVVAEVARRSRGLEPPAVSRAP